MIEIRSVGPKSIIMLIRALDGGGAQRDAITLANGLARAGWPIAIATLDAAGPLRQRIADAVPIIDLGQGRKLRMAQAIGPLATLLRQARPAAVIASEASGNCLLALVLDRLAPSQRPAIILREVASPLAARRHDPYWQNRLAYRLAPWLYPRADRVVCLTKAVQHELVDHFGVAPYRAVHLGTNAVLDHGDLAQLARPMFRDPGAIVAVGRLSPEKDFQRLIKAFAALSLVHPVRLTILGEGPERARLERLIAERGLGQRVSLPGFVANPLEYVRRARLLVSASRYEGFGNAIVEALACGTPVVATDAPHGPREILADGQFGILVPPGNATALAFGMARALRMPVESGPLRARAAEFTTERAVAAFGAMLGELGLSAAPQPIEELA